MLGLRTLREKTLRGQNWTNGLQWYCQTVHDRVQGEFDLVLSNPPLHTQTTKLLELIRLSAEATRRGRKMLMVLEDSRVPDIKASIDLLVGSVEERARTPSHVVLQYTRPR